MMHYELLIVSVAGSLMLAGCAVRPATPLSITLASPSVRQEGQVAIYLEVCDVPAPIRMTGGIEVFNDGRERSAIERDLVDRAARSGANAIILRTTVGSLVQPIPAPSRTASIRFVSVAPQPSWCFTTSPRRWRSPMLERARPIAAHADTVAGDTAPPSGTFTDETSCE